MTRTAYLDTSIFVEMGTKRSKHKPKIKALLEELQKDRVRIYTSMITVQELAVATYRAGAVARDTFADINAFARVYGITKEVALTAAKNEAVLKDLAQSPKNHTDRTETEEQKLERICENRRRKWDCFHIATAQQIGCSEMYTTDDKLQKRPGQLGIRSLKIIEPGTSVKRISGSLVENAGSIEVK